MARYNQVAIIPDLAMHLGVNFSDIHAPFPLIAQEPPATFPIPWAALPAPSCPFASQDWWTPHQFPDYFHHDFLAPPNFPVPLHEPYWEMLKALPSTRSTVYAEPGRIPNPMAAIMAVAKKAHLSLVSPGEGAQDSILAPTERPRLGQSLPPNRPALQAVAQTNLGNSKGQWKASDTTNFSHCDSNGFFLPPPVRPSDNSVRPTPGSLPFPLPSQPEKPCPLPSEDSLGLPLTTLLHDPPAKPQIKGCNCRQSMCLKLYCPCFSAGGSCSPECSCQECRNTAAHAPLRDSVAQRIEELNPLAFRSRFATTQNSSTGIVNARGCTCQRSQCAKYYCDCFKAGLKCSEICKCLDCANHKVSLVREDVEKYRQKIKRRRQKRTLYSVFGLQKKHRKARNQKDSFS